MNEEIEVVLAYLKSLREEIHFRVQKHTRLVWIKIMVLGAIMSCLIGKLYEPIMEGKSLESESPLLYFVWVLPLASVIFDILIASNLRVICNLGQYIKHYLEGCAFEGVKDKIRKDLSKKNLFSVEKAQMVYSNRQGRIAQKLRGWNWFKNLLAVKTLQKSGWLQKLMIPNLSQELRDKFEKSGFSIEKAKLENPKEGNNEWRIIDEKRVFIGEEKENGYVNIKHPEFGFWEEKAAQAAMKYHCYTMGDIFVVWLFTGATGIFAFFLRREIGFTLADYVFTGICILLSSVSLIWLLRSIMMERRF